MSIRALPKNFWCCSPKKQLDPPPAADTPERYKRVYQHNSYACCISGRFPEVSGSHVSEEPDSALIRGVHGALGSGNKMAKALAVNGTGIICGYT